MRLLTFLLLFTPLLLSAKDKSYTLILPNHPDIVYEGRIDFSNPEKAEFAYPGVSITAGFEGSLLEVLLEDFGNGGEQNTNYFNVTIDDSLFVLKLEAHKKVYRIPVLSSRKTHIISLFKRTESSVGKVAFNGFHIEKGKKIIALATTPNRIELIGDSFGCGYGNELSIAPPPSGDPNTGFHSVNENNYNAWCAITCRNLRAKYMCTAYSGRGLMRNNTGSTYGTMPLIYDQIIADDSSTHWDHSQWHPDVILIALGANDFFTGVPDSVAFVSTYIAFVNRLRELHPDASIVCIAGNGMSDWWPEGEFRWTHTQNYIKSVVNNTNSSGDSNVYYLMLSPQTPPYGEDWHPSNATHQKMAATVTEYLKQLKNW